MAPKRKIQRSTESPEAGYPSLRGHLTSRRRFLEVAGVAAAAGGLAVACGRAMGNQGQPDSSVPDAPGGDPGPSYFTLRLPAEGELYAYLIDGGSAQFYVELATYNVESYQALLDHFEDAANRARSTLQEYTYDGLNSAQGVLAAEDDLHGELDALIGELNGHDVATLEAVTLTITYLDSEPILMGEAPYPSYP
jgi:hypothetical protein